MPANQDRLSKEQRRAAAQARAEALRKAQEAKERRRRLWIVVAAVAVVALIAVAVVAIVQEAGKTKLDAVADAPNGATRSGAIPVGKDGAGSTNSGVPTVTVYMDFMCPGCGSVEQIYGSTIDKLVSEGKITLESHPLANLDRLSNDTAFSTRSANAAAVIADGAPTKYLAFVEGMFANQPEENSDGLSDAEIANIATEAGVPTDVVDQLTSGKFSEWVQAATAQAQTDGVTSTPWIEINGKRWEPTGKADELVTAVEEAS